MLMFPHFCVCFLSPQPGLLFLSLSESSCIHARDHRCFPVARKSQQVPTRISSASRRLSHQTHLRPPTRAKLKHGEWDAQVPHPRDACPRSSRAHSTRAMREEDARNFRTSLVCRVAQRSPPVLVWSRHVRAAFEEDAGEFHVSLV
jgi:hypothetical protein